MILSCIGCDAHFNTDWPSMAAPGYLTRAMAAHAKVCNGRRKF